MPLHILCIGAHPDDNEVSIGGTAALFRQRGDVVKFVSVTDGSKGHFDPTYIHDPDALVRRRFSEARNAANVIGATYESMGVPDGEVYVNAANTEEMVRILRGFGPEGRGPDLVLLNRPNDYHRDHRYTAQLVLDASYMLTVPAMCPDTPHLSSMPVFAYWDDAFTEGGAFRADVVVPIDSVIETKGKLCAAHVSQFYEWLPFNMGKFSGFPGDPSARLTWLTDYLRSDAASLRARFSDLAPESASYIEAFQISEYGRQPGADELKSLFPGQIG